MKYLLIICLFLTILIFSQEKNFIDANYIEVTGTAEMEIEPDEIYLNISIQEADLKKGKTIEEVEKEMISRLKNLAINTDKDLQIRNLGGNFQTYLLKKDQIQTYKNYLLKVSTGKQVSQVLILLNDLNISSVNIEKTSHTKIEEFRREVKVNAVKIAKKKAVDMLTSIDDTCGKALYILETDNSYMPMQPQYSNVAMSKMQDVAPESEYNATIGFEKIKLQYKILARFQILD